MYTFVHFFKKACVGIVCAVLAVVFIPFHTQAEEISFVPISGTYAVGSTFSVSVVVSSKTQAVNAVSGSISFPQEDLQVLSVSKNNSVISLWVQEPLFSNVSGTVSFEGVSLNPGFTGVNKKIIEVTFKVLKEGQIPLSFASASVLANDGTGTNILKSIGNALYVSSSGIDSEIVPVKPVLMVNPLSPKAPVIISQTHPKSSSWYATSTASFSWKLPEDVTAVRLSYTKDPYSQPSVVYENPISSKTITDVPDGTFYFHAQFKNAKGWGEIAHYKFNTDITPPVQFTVNFPHGAITESPQPILLFNTKDTMAGIEKYVVRVGEDVPIRVGPIVDSNPYVLPPQKPGKHRVLVEAYDRAGNISTALSEFEIKSINPPEVTLFDSEITYGDLVKVRGTSYPNSSIELHVYNSDDNLIHTDFSKTNSLGDFSVIVTKRIDSGSYTFTLSVTDASGAQSVESKRFVFRIKGDLVSSVTKSVALYIGLGVIVCVLVVSLVALLYFLHTSSRKLRRTFKKEMEHIDKDVVHSFELLKQEIGAHISKLEKKKIKNKISKEEIEILEDLKKSLDKIEGTVLEDINEAKKNVR